MFRKNQYVQAFISISPNWELEFHVHTYASHLVVITILAQNPISKFDQLVMYASRLLNLAERNYANTKREALTMVYVLQKFIHYLLGSRFIFYVDHMALVCLVNKPHVYGIITRWLLLFLEYDCKIVYKLGRSHLMAYALCKLPNY